MIDRRMLLAGGGAALGIGLWQIRGLAAEALGYDATSDFALTGQLTQGGWARGRAPLGTRMLGFNRRAVAVAPDRSFFIAFDRDAALRADILADLGDGTTTRGQLTIAPRAWQIERIPLGPKPGAPPNPEYARRREGELAQINAARGVDHAIEGWRQKFIWPAYGRISGRFGSQRIYNGTPGSYHSGMDIATGTSGTPFVAPADGVVTLAAASSFSLEGRLLMIDHGMGLNSAFLHCSAHAVKVGDVVRQGQFIGRIGMTGRATGPHLHWSVKWRDARLDPLLFVGAMPKR
ncbi:M23 family metallopeptidase [Novosphingobium sp.]|uniref:M23 family metallopeptidase n=1 Tax=Novosphingobium sp. TaxID=1874826 RepID=UPI00286CDDA8|nr:M23 family metallopeptidase [Novosphingobium sp.]